MQFTYPVPSVPVSFIPASLIVTNPVTGLNRKTKILPDFRDLFFIPEVYLFNRN